MLIFLSLETLSSFFISNDWLWFSPSLILSFLDGILLLVFWIGVYGNGWFNGTGGLPIPPIGGLYIGGAPPGPIILGLIIPGPGGLNPIPPGGIPVIPPPVETAEFIWPGIYC